MEAPKLILTQDSMELHYGDEVRTVPQAQLDAVIAQVFAPSGVFMPAVRWISPGGHAVVMERPPFVARCAYRPGVADQLDEKSAQHYNIPVPWQVYGIAFSADFREIRKMFVFCRNAPMFDPTSSLHMFPYPNVFNTAEACMGPMFQTEMAAHPAASLSEAIAKTVNAFWSADFNEDAGPNTWYAGWRCPLTSLPRAWADQIQAENVIPWKLLRYYSEIPLKTFLDFAFPQSNNLFHGGDTVQHLIDTLHAHEPTPLGSGGDLFKALRELFNKGFANAPSDRRKLRLPPKQTLPTMADVNPATDAVAQLGRDGF